LGEFAFAADEALSWWCMNLDLLEEAKRLPLVDRAELFEALWESLREEGYDPDLTPAQATELDARLQDHREHPEDVVSWEEVKAGASRVRQG
jgi:putative addiction module component (TIGR02574 family)